MKSIICVRILLLDTTKDYTIIFSILRTIPVGASYTLLSITPTPTLDTYQSTRNDRIIEDFQESLLSCVSTSITVSIVHLIRKSCSGVRASALSGVTSPVPPSQPFFLIHTSCYLFYKSHFQFDKY